jgi:hypothetical protein
MSDVPITTPADATLVAAPAPKPVKIREKVVHFYPGVYEALEASRERDNATATHKMDFTEYHNRLLMAACQARQTMKEAA